MLCALIRTAYHGGYKEVCTRAAVLQFLQEAERKGQISLRDGTTVCDIKDPSLYSSWAQVLNACYEAWGKQLAMG